MLIRILSSSLAVAALASATPAFAIEPAWSSGDGLTSIDLRSDVADATRVASDARAFPDGLLLWGSGNGLTSLDLRREAAAPAMSGRVAVASLAEGEPTRAVSDVRSAGSGSHTPAAGEILLGADPFNRGMDAGG